MPLDLVTLLVDDHDAALAFLTSGLGFEVAQDEPSTGSDGLPKRWVVVRHGDGGAGLVLALAKDDEQRAAVGRQVGGRVGFFLQVDDTDAVCERVVAAGGRVVGPLRDETYGRVAVIRDPWGNHWDLLGPVG